MDSQNYTINTSEVPDVARLAAVEAGRLATMFYNKNVVTMPFLLDPAQLAYIQSVFPTQHIRIHPNAVAHTHPVSAFFNRFAYENVKETYRGVPQEQILDIGSNYTKHDKYHKCVLINNTRDAYRYANTAISQMIKNNQDPLAVNELYHAAQGMRTPVCVKGVENCDYQAPYAFAINSMYDIRFEDIYKIFAMHGLIKMVAYMFLPPGLAHDSLAKIHLDEHFYDYSATNGRSTFALGDFTPPYTHETNNWRKYLTHTHIYGKDFNVAAEITRSDGVFFKINFIRVPSTLKQAMSRALPYASLYKAYYLIPNLFADKTSNQYRKAKELMLVPVDFADKVIQFIMRLTKDSLKSENILSYASGLVNKITFNGKILHHGLHVNFESYIAIVFTLLVIGAKTRFNFTKGIAARYSHIHGAEGIVSTLYRQLREYITSKWDIVQSHISDTVFPSTFDLSDADIMNVTLRTVPSFIENGSAACSWHGRNFVNVPINAGQYVQPTAATFAAANPTVVVEQEVEIPPPATSTNINVTNTVNVAKTLPITDYEKVVYSPPGDGNCLLGCFAHILGVSIDSIRQTCSSNYNRNAVAFLSTRSSIELVFEDITPEWPDKQWLNITDAAFIAACYQSPICIHTEYAILRMPGAKVSISLTKNHYRVILCDCNPQGGYLQSEPASHFLDVDIRPDVAIWKRAGATQPTAHDMAQKFFFCLKNVPHTGLFEVSLAPGIFIQAYKREFPNNNIAGSHYIGDDCENGHSQLMRDFDIRQLRSYCTFKDLRAHPRIHDYEGQVIIIDIGPAASYEHVVPSYARLINFVPKSHILIKCFALHKNRSLMNTNNDLLRFARVVSRATTLFKPPHSRLSSSEFYVLLSPVLKDLPPPTSSADFFRLLINPPLELLDVDVDHTKLLEFKPQLAYNNANPDAITAVLKLAMESEMQIVYPVCPFPPAVVTTPSSIKPVDAEVRVIAPEPAPVVDEFQVAVNAIEYIPPQPVAPEITNTSKCNCQFGVDVTIEFNAGHCSRFIDSIPNDEGNVPGTAAALRNMPISRFAACTRDITLTFITGVAGCGKSRFVREYNHLRTLYITPISKLKEQFENIRGLRVCTHITALRLLQTQKFDTIFVDECYTLPLGYFVYLASVTKARIYALGDPKQIPLVDFNSVYQVSDSLSNYYSVWQCNHSKRFGPNIATYLSKVVGQEILSTVELDTRIVVVTGPVLHFEQEYPNHNRITFSRDNKAAINGNTIHECQGSTFADVALYVDVNDCISDTIHTSAYHYVAFSRSTREIVVYGAADAVACYHVIGSAIDRTLTHAGIVLHDDNVVQDKLINITTFNTGVKLPDARVDVQTIEEILTRVVKSANDDRIIGITENDLMKYGGGGQIQVQLAQTTPGTTVRGRRIGHKNFCRYYSSKDKKQTLDTLMTRYTKDMKRGLKDTRKFADQLREGFLKFTKFDNTEALFNYWRQGATVEVIQKHALDYLRALQQKIGSDASAKTMKELDEMTKDVHENGRKFTIDFFMKNQPKHATAHNFDEQYKAGQGVSCYPKMFNIFLSAFFRYINSTLQDVLADNVLYASGQSDAKIGAFFNTYREQLADPKYKKVSDDISEFDTTHMLFTIMDTISILDGLGFGTNVIEVYFKNCVNWHMSNRGSPGANHVWNSMMMTSGRADTLTTNTRVIIGLTGMMSDIKGLVAAGFKGDDSVLITESFIKRLGLKKTIAEELGVKCKTVIAPVVEFIAMILTPYGPFPDLVRRTVKVCSNIYTDDAEWGIARKNMRDSLNVVQGQRDYNGGLHFAKIYYEQIGMNFSIEELDRMYNFLNQLAETETNPGTMGDFYIHHL